VEYKSSNFVPIVPVNLKSGTPTSLSLVSDLTKEDDIVLAMGPGSADNAPRHTIDTSPLYRMVHFTFLVHQTTQQSKLGNMVVDVGTTCHGRRWAASGT